MYYLVLYLGQGACKLADPPHNHPATTSQIKSHPKYHNPVQPTPVTPLTALSAPPIATSDRDSDVATAPAVIVVHGAEYFPPYSCQCFTCLESKTVKED